MRMHMLTKKCQWGDTSIYIRTCVHILMNLRHPSPDLPGCWDPPRFVVVISVVAAAAAAGAAAAK